MAKEANSSWSLTKQHTVDWKVAYGQGYKAAQQGKSFNQNPYRYGTHTYDGWAKGWEACGKWRSQ